MFEKNPDEGHVDRNVVLIYFDIFCIDSVRDILVF